jgi:hypothetical protein
MKKQLYAAGVTLAVPAVVAFSAPAFAMSSQNDSNNDSNNHTVCTPVDGASVNVPIDTIKTGDEGSVHTLATKTVDNGTYQVKVVAENQDSVHPNSNIIVSSGDSKVVVKNVEAQAFHDKTAKGTLKVENGKVKVQVKLGSDDVFSGGGKVQLSQCHTKTTTPPQKTPQTPPETTKPTKPTKPEKPAPAPKPTPQPTPTPEQPSALPNTGPGATAAVMGGGATLFGTALEYVRIRRRNR